MATPPSSKTVRVSPEVHQKLMNIADRLNGTADDAIAHLIGESTVRVPVSEVQRARWIKAAQRAGLPIAEFVRSRVEGAIEFGGGAAGLQAIYEHVLGLCRAAGVGPVRVPPRAPAVDKETNR